MWIPTHVRVWIKNLVHLAQYRITTVKTIAAPWLFILQLIKVIQLVKHLGYAVLLECGWLRHFFFGMTCRLGTFLLFWQCVWALNFFFFLHGKISFFTYLAKFLFFFFQVDSFFNFRQNFKGKSYTRLLSESTYIRKYTVIEYEGFLFIRN